MTTKSCYYCDDPGTETIVVGGIRYWFCPNHKQVLISWLEEDQEKKAAARSLLYLLGMRADVEADGLLTAELSPRGRLNA